MQVLDTITFLTPIRPSILNKKLKEICTAIKKLLCTKFVNLCTSAYKA